MPDTHTGVYVQISNPHRDLFLADGDRWTRADGRVYVYDDSEETPNPVAEVPSEHFVSAAHTTAESLADVPTVDPEDAL